MQRATLGLAVLATGTALQPPPVRANDLGCQLLPCLSKPGGATQYAQCVPPMTKLWQRLDTDGSFPGCSGGVLARTKLYDRDSATRRRVVMTFSDGRRETYSLANIEQDGAR